MVWLRSRSEGYSEFNELYEGAISDVSSSHSSESEISLGNFRLFGEPRSTNGRRVKDEKMQRCLGSAFLLLACLRIFGMMAHTRDDRSDEIEGGSFRPL